MFISCLYMFRAPCAHRQEVKIVLYSLWYHHTETSEWSKITKITKITKICLFHASTCFEHTCSSSGGQNCTIQPLLSSQWNK